MRCLVTSSASKDEDLTRDFRDDAWGMPKAVVIDNAFDWEADKRPGIPLHSSVIYEVHVKGFSNFARMCRKNCAEPMPAWAARQRSSI